MPPVSSRTTTRSTPASFSALSGAAAASFSCTVTGRTLAKRPSALRMPSSPCSGRTFARGVSHAGPPTAPRSTASLARQSATVSSGSGFPVASMAAPPISADVVSNECPHRSATASSTRTPCATTSGPMPSPGSSAIFARISVRSRARALVGGDLHFLRGEIAELVDTLEHAVAREGIDGEVETLTARECERLRFEIDREARRWLACDQRRDALDDGLRQRDGKKPVAERVVAEDVRELAAHHGAKAVAEERPRRMLARGTAAEVLSGHQ